MSPDAPGEQNGPDGWAEPAEPVAAEPDAPGEPDGRAEPALIPAAPRPIDRLVSFGTVVVDLITAVPALPERGGDVFAAAGSLAAGGGFTVMAAARRAGLPTLHAGTTGTGPFGDLARAALAAAGIQSVLAPVPGVDTGLSLVLVEPDGERTFVTVPGAEGRFEPGLLDQVPLRARDAVYLSGYGFAHPVTGRAIRAALAGMPAAATLIVDPGPLGHELDPADLAALFARADWFSCNAREATLLTGRADPVAAAAVLAELVCGDPAFARRTKAGSPKTNRPAAHIVVRTGAQGCLWAVVGRAPVPVGVQPVAVTSSNGAGDVHTGSLLAALAAGRPPLAALRQANASAVRFLQHRA